MRHLPHKSKRTIYRRAYEHVAAPLPSDYLAPCSLPEIRLHEIDLYVTMRCNLGCTFCSVRAGEYDHRELPLDRCLSLIDEAAELGLQELHLLGGEPTLRDDLGDMIAHATRRGIDTRIITNGVTLTLDDIKRLRDVGLGELMISVDGMADSHNALRRSGRGGWHRTMRCVDNAIRADIRARVATTAYDDNYDDVLPLLRDVSDRGAECYSVFLGSPLGRGHGMLARVVSPQRWRALQEAVAAELPKLRADLSVIMEQAFAWSDKPAVDRASLKGRGTGCNTLLDDLDYLIVRSDGNLYQCVFFMTEGKPIGNVRDQPLKQTLQYALQRAEYRQFTLAPEKCGSCFYQAECGTGCRGYSYLLANDWFKSDPRCSKSNPRSNEAPPFFPLCPILKWNARTGLFGGSSEQALKT